MLWIAITIDFRHGPSETTVFGELEALQRLGPDLRDDSCSCIGARWAVTDAAWRASLDRAAQHDLLMELRRSGTSP